MAVEARVPWQRCYRQGGSPAALQAKKDAEARGLIVILDDTRQLPNHHGDELEAETLPETGNSIVSGS